MGSTKRSVESSQYLESVESWWKYLETRKTRFRCLLAFEKAKFTRASDDSDDHTIKPTTLISSVSNHVATFKLIVESDRIQSSAKRYARAFIWIEFHEVWSTRRLVASNLSWSRAQSCIEEMDEHSLTLSAYNSFRTSTTMVYTASWKGRSDGSKTDETNSAKASHLSCCMFRQYEVHRYMNRWSTALTSTNWRKKIQKKIQIIWVNIFYVGNIII